MGKYWITNKESLKWDKNFWSNGIWFWLIDFGSGSFIVKVKYHYNSVSSATAVSSLCDPWENPLLSLVSNTWVLLSQMWRVKLILLLSTVEKRVHSWKSTSCTSVCIGAIFPTWPYYVAILGRFSIKQVHTFMKLHPKFLICQMRKLPRDTFLSREITSFGPCC